MVEDLRNLFVYVSDWEISHLSLPVKLGLWVWCEVTLHRCAEAFGSKWRMRGLLGV
jgi:hypothetical protein